MARLLLLTDAPGASVEVLPALGLLSHRVRILAPQPQALVDPPECDVVVLDARRDLIGARDLSRVLRTSGLSAPLVAIFTEGGLAALTGEWQIDDVILDSAGPAEVDARLRFVISRVTEASADDEPSQITAGGLVIDEDAYAARIHGHSLDLTYKEFELLKHLAAHPGRVFTRAQLLQEVWGYDYFGGTRTVDVHVRRLRAKLGPEHESLIGTIRNVGYRFVGTAGSRQREDASVAE
jgi:DNA-binding response OmpR family regulator